MSGRRGDAIQTLFFAEFVDGGDDGSGAGTEDAGLALDVEEVEVAAGGEGRGPPFAGAMVPESRAGVEIKGESDTGLIDGIVPIVNVELNENMEFAYAPSNPLSGAERTPHVGRRGDGGCQIPSYTPLGEPRAEARTRHPGRSVKRPKPTPADRLLWAWL